MNGLIWNGNIKFSTLFFLVNSNNVALLELTLRYISNNLNHLLEGDPFSSIWISFAYYIIYLYLDAECLNHNRKVVYK